MGYQARVVHLERSEEVAALLTGMGCDSAGISIMTPKALFKTVLLENVSTKAANLLKQTFLAKGAEVAVTRGTADLSVEYTGVLICGTLKHYRQALSQLRQQPWGLPALAAAVDAALKNEEQGQRRCYRVNESTWSVEPGKTLIMGILNLTPDSFSDGGRYNEVEAAVARAMQMIEEGADMIDIGAESTRPYGGAEKVSAAVELERLLPVLERVLAAATVPVSVDTYKGVVAMEALALGAQVLNDIWGLQRDSVMAEAAARYKVPVILMHNRDSTESTQDIMSEMLDYFVRSMEIGSRAGIAEDRFILDPGIGFGKNAAQNLEILGRLSELKSLGCPLLVGTSRKRFIGDVLGLPVEDRVEGTGATLVHAIMQGASILRVHDVKSAKRMAVMTDALQGWRGHGHG